MKRNRPLTSLANPFLLWTDLAVKTGEMMLASAQVISHRTSRMSRAGPTPNARDRREFALMGHEKIEASVESAQAIAMQLIKVNPLLGAHAARQMLTSATALVSLGASRTVGEAITRQAAVIRAITQAAGTASRLSGSAARVAQRGLKPIHARARANARRLARLNQGSSSA